MRILTRHVLREFLEPVSYCLLGFTLVYLVVDLFSQFDRIMTARPPWSMVVNYMVGYLSALVQWLLPASLLLGGLYAMWQLARHSEITAMRASGVGFMTIAAPMLWTSVVLAILSALNSEFYAPEASREARRISKNKFEPRTRQICLDVPYNNYAEQRVWRVNRLDQDRSSRLVGVRITETSADGVPRSVLTARSAEYLDGVWWFYSPFFTHYDESGNLSRTQPDALNARSQIDMPQYSETPRDFLLEVRQFDSDQEALSLRDMIRYVKARPRLPRSIKVARRYDIHQRLASPWACVVITLFAVPAGVASGRQSVFKGVLMAIGLFFAFYAMTQVCMVRSKKDMMPVGLGAWLPNLVFLAAGAILFYRQR
ncbi:MAG: LptF/LptG family permease [Kiritimatiellae bacterium]|nr:LptF/LptG family permease [Kiritimatiellia bacterium]